MSQEIQEKFNQLLEERRSLYSAWQRKKVHLDQLIDLHFFLRDAKQIDTLCTAQEAALSATDFGITHIFHFFPLNISDKNNFIFIYFPLKIYYYCYYYDLINK